MCGPIGLFQDKSVPVLSKSPSQTLQPLVQYRARHSRLHAQPACNIAYLAAVVVSQGYGIPLARWQTLYCRSYVQRLCFIFTARDARPVVILEEGGKVAEEVWAEGETGAGIVGVEQLAVL